MKVRIVLLIICLCGMSCEQQAETPAGNRHRPVVEEPERVELKLNQDQALIVAAFNLDTERVKELLEAGADPDARLGFYDHYLFADDWVLAYSPTGSDEWTPLLAVASSFREPPPAVRPKNSQGALERALEERHSTDLKTLEERDRRRVQIAGQLIAAGADVDADDGYGATVLSRSVANGYQQLALLLIESGADPNTKTDPYINGPRDVAPLHDAAFYPEVLAALLEHGADVNVVTSDGDTPLHYATLAGQLESVKLLIAAGVDVNARNKHGELASNRAFPNSEMKKLLKEAEEKAAKKNRQR